MKTSSFLIFTLFIQCFNLIKLLDKKKGKFSAYSNLLDVNEDNYERFINSQSINLRKRNPYHKNISRSQFIGSFHSIGYNNFPCNEKLDCPYWSQYCFKDEVLEQLNNFKGVCKGIFDDI